MNLQREDAALTAFHEREKHAAAQDEEEQTIEMAGAVDTSPAAVMARAKEQFFGKIKLSEDLEDNLQELVEFIQTQTQSTGVYVGKLVYPSKEIDEEADDKAHLDDEAPKVIKYMHASKGHEFMVDVVLSNEEAVISHEVFKEGEDEAAEEDGEEVTSQAAQKDIITSFPHQFVPEVVRESRMHF